MKRGDRVTYRAWEGQGAKVSAIVRTVHRDGTATVDATWAEGDPIYLGYRYRMRLNRLENEPNEAKE